MAIGHQQRVVAPGLPGVERHRPGAVAGVPYRALHAGLERDPFHQPEVARVVLEIRRDLRVMREVRE